MARAGSQFGPAAPMAPRMAVSEISMWVTRDLPPERDECTRGDVRPCLASPHRRGHLRLVLVVVIIVGCVHVTVVNVVRVPLMLHAPVPAPGAVRVLGGAVLGDGLVLVVVVAVQSVVMRAVHIIDVVAVLDRLVAAVGAVRVVGGGVLRVDVDAHAHSFCSGS